jgi:hypothetical protein
VLEFANLMLCDSQLLVGAAGDSEKTDGREQAIRF